MSTDLIIHEDVDIPYQLSPLSTPTPKAAASLTSHYYAQHVAMFIAAIKASLQLYYIPSPDEVIYTFEMEYYTDTL